MGEESLQLICSENEIILLQKKEPSCNLINRITPISNEFVGKLNISSISRLERLTSLIEQDVINFDVHDNHIRCKSKNFEYKMFLSDNSRLREFREDILKSIVTPYKFIITYDEYMILKRNAKLVDSLYKIYLHSEDSVLKASLTDKEKPYSNEITFDLESKSDLPQIILPSEFLTIPHFSKDEVLPCRTDGKRILFLEIDQKQYIFSTLLK